MKGHTKCRRGLARVIGVILGLMVWASIPLATANASHRPTVFPIGSTPFGRTYAEWGAAWWQWAMAIPAGANPIMDAEGTDCAIGQKGPVWFLAGTSGGSVTRSCTIPSGMAIFFPIVNTVNDFPCPDPTFKPQAGQTLEDFLTQGAKAGIDQVNLLEVEVDGQPLGNLRNFRATSRLFQFTTAGDLSSFDSCATGSPQLGVSDGYWIMLNPLRPGSHTIHFKGGLSFGFTSEATYQLTIE